MTRICPTCKRRWNALTGAQCRAIRRAARWTLRDMARFLGVHFSYLSKIENNRTPISCRLDFGYREVRRDYGSRGGKP